MRYSVQYKYMPRTTQRTTLINGLLRVIALGGITTAALIAPATVSALDRPLQKYLQKLEDSEAKRELNSALTYIRYHKLVAENYLHGLSLTEKARTRLVSQNIQNLTINTPSHWDHQWRIIFFDIPEKYKSKRDGFAARIRELGFAVLQRSVFIHPYPCREEVATLASHFEVDECVTYIETSYIDNDSSLREHFKLS